MLVGSELTNSWYNGASGKEWDWASSGLRFVEEDVLLDRREALAAVLCWPADSKPAVTAYLPDQRLVVGVFGELSIRNPSFKVRCHQVAEVDPQLGLEGLLVIG